MKLTEGELDALVRAGKVRIAHDSSAGRTDVFPVKHAAAGPAVPDGEALTVAPTDAGSSPPARPGPVDMGHRMNRTEARYAGEVLEPRKREGAIVDYRFEALSLRLALATWYRIDFLVVTPDEFQVHEVKGYWHDDARVKTKTAQQLFPWWRFLAVTAVPKKDGGGWDVETFAVV